MSKGGKLSGQEFGFKALLLVLFFSSDRHTLYRQCQGTCIGTMSQAQA